MLGAEHEALRDVGEQHARDHVREREHVELGANAAARLELLEQLRDAPIQRREHLLVDERRFAAREQRVHVQEAGELAIGLEESP